MVTLTTFNANNFFLRYKFSRRYPGDRSGVSQVEATEIATHGFLPDRPFQKYGRSRYIVWDEGRRQLAFAALKEPDGQLPDILCLQEVENIHAIRVLNKRYFGNYYQYSLLIDAYDPRNIDVGVLSTLPITRVRSHIDFVSANGQKPFANRDCLEFDVQTPDGKKLTIFNIHLKSKYTENGTAAELREAHLKRQIQAECLMDIIEEKFHGRQTTALYAVVGDFNDTPESPWLSSLKTPRLKNIISEYIDLDNRWTYYWRSRNRVSQIDHIMASRALAKRIEEKASTNSSYIPHIERSGLGYRKLNAVGKVLPAKPKFVHYEVDAATPPSSTATPDSYVDFRFPRYQPIMNNWRNNISDHCPVKIWL